MRGFFRTVVAIISCGLFACSTTSGKDWVREPTSELAVNPQLPLHIQERPLSEKPTDKKNQIPSAPPVPDISFDQGALEQLNQDVQKILATSVLAKAKSSVVAIDVVTGKALVQYHQELLLKPASTMKVLTTSVALGMLGPAYRFETTVVTEAEIDDHGVVHGDLVLVGGHDFTWSTLFDKNPGKPLNALAEQISNKGISRVEGSLVAAGEFLYDGQRFSTLNPVKNRYQALLKFEHALRNHRVRISKRKHLDSLNISAQAKTLATWTSKPLSEAIVPLNRLSHNEFADDLLRHVGWKIQKESSYQSGATVVHRWLREHKIPEKELVFNDGSGLSHLNRIRAQTLADVLRVVALSPHAKVFRNSLALSGTRGTLRTRLKTPLTQGLVWGKTGTLNSVTTLCGYLQHPTDHRLYAFAIMFNDLNGLVHGKRAQDKILVRLAQRALLSETQNTK
jgi:serine-type D-Ala-D-Ala carboxypeptidase/endopeptidase (penicillin-binding protein 4)